METTEELVRDAVAPLGPPVEGLVKSPTEVAETPPLRPATAADLGRICRAAVAALNGRDAAIIKLERVAGDVAYTRYARPDDGKVWKNRCRLDGERVVWAAVDLDGPGSGPGRWRIDPYDEVVTYRLVGDEVHIRIAYSDDSGSDHVYSLP